MPKPFVDPQTKALFDVGFVKPIDFMFVGALLSIVAIGSAHWFFGALPFVGILTYALLEALIMQVWLIILVIRSMWFTVQVMADIKMMPSDAAKLALRFSQQGVSDNA